MTDYGRGGVLGAATMLPATSAVGLVLLNNANPIIVGSLFVVSGLSLLVLVSSICRFMINRRSN